MQNFQSRKENSPGQLRSQLLEPKGPLDHRLLSDSGMPLPPKCLFHPPAGHWMLWVAACCKEKLWVGSLQRAETTYWPVPGYDGLKDLKVSSWRLVQWICFFLCFPEQRRWEPVSKVTGCLISLMKTGPAREELEPQLNLIRRPWVTLDRNQTDQHNLRSHESFPCTLPSNWNGTWFRS